MTQISDNSQRGAALFVVLLFAAIIANLAFIALRFSSSEIRASIVFADRASANALGRSVVPLTRYYISQDGKTRSRGGSFTTDVNDAKMTIDYRCECARVDINRSPLDLLEAVLLSGGLSQANADAIAGRVGQRRASQPPDPYESPFEATDDWSLSDSEARKIIPLLTIANEDGGIDPLLARSAVLALLFDNSETRIAQFRDKRMIGFPDEQTALSYFSEPVKKWLKIGSVSAVQAIATVTTRRGLRRRFEAVFDIEDKADTQKIYYWRPLD
jgi:type II secretory pathway component PulK